MNYLRVEHLSLTLERAEADEAKELNSVSFEVDQNEIVGILGPSGAGKSLVLRAILGLERPDEGEVFLEGEALSERPAAGRGMAYLSQRLVLYPHLPGEVNAGFFYWIRKQFSKKHEIRFHPVVREILTHLHLTEASLLERLPRSLAGGEKQRIALARALASEAKILLLDEPLANIEDNFRDVLRHFLRDWIKKRGQTALVVSHNQEEMASLCDRLLLMDQGRIIQQGGYEELCFSPVSRITALFMGNSRKNFLSAEFIEKRWKKKCEYDVVLLPQLGKATADDPWDLEVEGKVIMVEHFFREKKKLLCVEEKNELFFWEVAETMSLNRGDRVRFFLPVKEGWFFERVYPYKRIYQGVFE
ncbi:ABC transporter ATP-binding protein [Thermospira aquatica]|uniref:ABC transporter ATP-binding protein n=1 Tax=Thermospira aquatica TaxID=2828656 RepID=A0AAX3BGD7_9SPIR|nr:ABC transporter ATP-binding protein [Thermospira aquatica]URA11286.1 ABC transporter ATP-binding protein [Thermospira aquatica]